MNLACQDIDVQKYNKILTSKNISSCFFYFLRYFIGSWGMKRTYFLMNLPLSREM